MSDAICSKYFATNCTIISQKAKHQLTRTCIQLTDGLTTKKTINCYTFSSWQSINPSSTCSRLILSKIQANRDSLMCWWIT